MMVATKGKLRLQIMPDEMADSPRDDCNMGHIVGWHRNYKLGDEQPSEDPIEWLLEYERENPDAVMLPVYMYEHGGVALSTGAFSCPWDSGQVGYIVSPPEKWEGLKVAQVIKNLTAEVATYGDYLNGAVWCYITERYVPSIVEGDPGTWDHEDSCGGFYAIEDMKEYMDDEYLPLLEELT